MAVMVGLSQPAGRMVFVLCVLGTTWAEDVINMDVSILDRVPEDSSSSLLADKDVRYRAFVQRHLVHPSQLVHVADDLVHLAVIASNINTTAIEADEADTEKVFRPEDEVVLYLRGFLRMMFSVFSTSTGTPVHLVMITDRASRTIAENTIVYSMGKYLSTAVIRNVRGRLPPPFPSRFLVEFANLTDITTTYRAEIDEMKKFYVFDKLPDPIAYGDGGFGVFSGKFLLDLFFIAPFYHLGKRTTDGSVCCTYGRL